MILHSTRSVLFFLCEGSMNFLDSIVSILTIATLVSSGFNYLVIRPIQKTIDMNTKALSD